MDPLRDCLSSGSCTSLQLIFVGVSYGYYYKMERPCFSIVFLGIVETILIAEIINYDIIIILIIYTELNHLANVLRMNSVFSLADMKQIKNYFITVMLHYRCNMSIIQHYRIP